MKNKKQIELRTQRVGKWMRLHIVLTAILFSAYFLAAFLYSPHFFLADVKDKMYALADAVVVTAKVLDEPVKPMVSVAATCDTNNGILSIGVDWADDENSYTYDVYRDGSTLMTNLANSSYTDTNVAVGTSYDYYVIAYGPMGPGSATSDTVSVATPAECVIILPDPVVETVTIDFTNVSGQPEGVQTTDQTPLFSGTTNIPFAIVDIVIHSNEYVVLQTTANVNGYWEIASPVELSLGQHTLSVTATDPIDSARTATHTVIFWVIEVIAPSVPVAPVTNSGNGDRDNHRKKKATPVTVPVQQPSSIKKPPVDSGNNTPVTAAIIPFDFTLRIDESEQPVFQGESIDTKIVITRLDERYASESGMIRYSIRDENGNRVVAIDKTINQLKVGQEIQESISLPADLKRGGYKLNAELISKEFNVIRTVHFSVAELPLFDFGSGLVITYPQFVSNIGWVAFVSLFLLLWWLLLWIREYWLYAHSVRHIAERNLSNKGLISKRRGVSS